MRSSVVSRYQLGLVRIGHERSVRSGIVTGEGGVELVPVQEQEPVDGRQDRRHRRPGGGSAMSVFTDSPWSGASPAM